MPATEYMTTEISKVIPMLSQSCDELTRHALIRGLTQKTQEWACGDPELADILLDGKKTLEECVRYVTEKAACVVSKNLNAMLNAELSELPKMRIQGREATMAGGAIDAEQVYQWAQEYYYNPDVNPTDFKAEAKRKAGEAKKNAEKKEAGITKKSATSGKESKPTDSTQPDSENENSKNKIDVGHVEQMNLFATAAA